MAAKHYRSSAKNNVLEMEETSSSQDAMQSPQCTVQDVGRRSRQSWPTLHTQTPKKDFFRGRFFSIIGKIKLRTPKNTHGYR